MPTKTTKAAKTTKTTTSSILTQTVCEWQDFNIECPSGTSIKVKSGFFGRTSNEICSDKCKFDATNFQNISMVFNLVRTS